MVEYLLTLSFLIIAILLIREIFRKNISPIITYLLWLAVVFKLIMPFSFFEAELSVRDKYKSDIVSSSDDELIDYESQDSEFIVPPPMIDITDNITTDITDKIDSSEDEISLLPGIENTDNDKLFDFSNLYNIIICIWVIGSAVMAIGFAVSGTVFYFRLRKDRILYRIVKKTKVYVSDNVGTPCLAGIFPSIYITSDSIKSKGQTLIIAHEYTHLRHGDHIWSPCRK